MVSMTKQFTPDLKLKAVNYYHKIQNYVQVCEIFECSERFKIRVALNYFLIFGQSLFR